MVQKKKEKKPSSAKRDEETLKSVGALCFTLCRSSAAAICFHVPICELLPLERRRARTGTEARRKKTTKRWGGGRGGGGGGDKRVELTRWEANKQTRAARGGATPLGVTLTAPFPREAESRVSVRREASIIQVKTRDTIGGRRIGKKKKTCKLPSCCGCLMGDVCVLNHWRDSKSCGGLSSWSERTYHSGIVCAQQELC